MSMMLPKSKLTLKEVDWLVWALEGMSDSMDDADIPITKESLLRDLYYRLTEQAFDMADQEHDAGAKRVLGRLVEKLNAEGFFPDSVTTPTREVW